MQTCMPAGVYKYRYTCMQTDRQTVGQTCKESNGKPLFIDIMLFLSSEGLFLFIKDVDLSLEFFSQLQICFQLLLLPVFL